MGEKPTEADEQASSERSTVQDFEKNTEATGGGQARYSGAQLASGGMSSMRKAEEPRKGGEEQRRIEPREPGALETPN